MRSVFARDLLGAAVLLLAASAAATAADDGVVRTTLPAAQVRTLTTGVRGPEGPAELPDGSVSMVEFTAGNIIRISQQGASDVLAHLGKGVAGTAMGRDGALYVAKMDLAQFMKAPRGGDAPAPAGDAPPSGGPGGGPAGDDTPGGLVRIDLATKQSKVVYATYEGQELGGPNDLLVDRWGDLWFTDPVASAVYNARTDGSKLQRMLTGIKGVNGIALSPDRSTLYVMNGRNLVSYAITGRGTLRSAGGKPRERLLAVWPEGIHDPDGLKTEAGGNIVAACWEDGILVFSPQGKWLSQTKVADLSVINIAFGGRDMKTLYLAGHPANNMVGSLAAISWPRAGLH